MPGASRILRALRHAWWLHRYGRGSGAFLTPMYGCGEVAQAFCRAAAVQGATVALRCPVRALQLDAGTGLCNGIRLASGQVSPGRLGAAAP